jgi:membrane protein YqaA with SNARE-associated domain
MSWIVVNIATPTLISLSNMMGKKLKQGLNLRPKNQKSGKEKQMKETLRSISYIIFLSSLVPVIGGFITVGQILREFGVYTLKQ